MDPDSKFSYSAVPLPSQSSPQNLSRSTQRQGTVSLEELPDTLSLEELQSGNFKFIRYTDNITLEEHRPQVRRKKMFRVLTIEDRAAYIADVQKFVFLQGFDMYSDIHFLHVLYTTAQYSLVTPWKKAAYLTWFIISMALWLAVGAFCAFAKQADVHGWKARMNLVPIYCFNGRIDKMNDIGAAKAYGGKHDYVALAAMGTNHQWEAFSRVYQLSALSSTVILQDLPLLLLNISITVEAGFCFPSISAAVMSVVGAITKIRELYRFCPNCHPYFDDNAVSNDVDV